MPERWPALASTAGAALARSMSGAMRERFRGVKGRPGRFDDPDARYVLRAFVRLKPECSCPARTVWSGYTEPFVIAPWYETTADPVQISAADLSTMFLKSLKPTSHSRYRQRSVSVQPQGPDGGESGRRLHDDRLDLQLQHPGDHVLRFHRAEHLPVPVRPDLPLTMFIKVCILPRR
jgi:hypothetical protein